jgi:hypothetical protein
MFHDKKKNEKYITVSWKGERELGTKCYDKEQNVKLLNAGSVMLFVTSNVQH